MAFMQFNSNKDMLDHIAISAADSIIADYDNCKDYSIVKYNFNPTDTTYLFNQILTSLSAFEFSYSHYDILHEDEGYTALKIYFQ